MSPALELQHIQKSWHSGWPRRRRQLALADVDLQIWPGEVVGLMGESGSGKTTLARIAVGLLRPDQGSVRVAGVNPQEQPKKIPFLAQLLFQDAGASLNPGLSVAEILEESLKVHGGKDRLPKVLERLDLLHRLQALPAMLSGGEKRRVTLAQAWLANTPLLIADEPTAGLDAARRAEVLDLLLESHRPDRSYLIISHDLALVRYACSRIIVMQYGRIVDDFPRDALFAADRHPWTCQLRQMGGMSC